LFQGRLNTPSALIRKGDSSQAVLSPQPKPVIRAVVVPKKAGDILEQDTPRHSAVTASTTAQVAAFYEAALAAGGTDNGAPGERSHYHPGYYGAFVLDPDGNNLEAVFHGAGD